MGLYDTVMLKENHVRAAGSIVAAVDSARALHPGLPLVIEVETLEQLREALAAGCDRILVDDFDAATRREAVRIARAARSEEHTSELQSLMRISYAVFCLNKKQITYSQYFLH